MANDKHEHFEIKTASDAAHGPLNDESSAIEHPSPPAEASALDSEPDQAAPNVESATPDPEATASQTTVFEAQKPRAPSRAPALAGGIVLGALIGAGGAIGLHYLDASRNRAGDIEAHIAGLSARADSIEQKNEAFAAGLAAMAGRIGAVESAAGKSAAATHSALDELQKALAARPPAAVSETDGQAPATPDLEPLKARTDAVEQKLGSLATALAASQSEIRAQQDREKADAAKQTSLMQSAAQSAAQSTAIVADRVRQKLEEGAPFGSEFATLESLGVSAAKLTPLRAVAKTGVSSVSKLADQFESVSAAVLAGEPAKKDAGFLERLTHDAAGLVRIRRENANGPDVESRVAQIQNALARGDLEKAYVLWTELPNSAQAKSAAWGEAAKIRLDALKAGAVIENDAVAALGKSKS